MRAHIYDSAASPLCSALRGTYESGLGSFCYGKLQGFDVPWAREGDRCLQADQRQVAGRAIAFISDSSVFSHMVLCYAIVCPGRRSAFRVALAGLLPGKDRGRPEDIVRQSTVRKVLFEQNRPNNIVRKVLSAKVSSEKYRPNVIVRKVSSENYRPERIVRIASSENYRPTGIVRKL